MKYQYDVLENWFKTEPGQSILNWEKNKIEPLTQDFLGNKAIQIGLTFTSFLEQSPILDKQYIIPSDTYSIKKTPYIYTPIEPLNLTSSSVDLLILPHTLELTKNPHQLIKEAHRILKKDGRIIITGFNPYSLWRLIQVFSKQYLPTPSNDMVSFRKLQGWLQQLGFCINHGEFGLYMPLGHTISKQHVLNKMGDRWWPSLSGLYFISAQKQPLGMSPTEELTERIRQRLQSTKPLVPNSTRTAPPIQSKN